MGEKQEFIRDNYPSLFISPDGYQNTDFVILKILWSLNRPRSPVEEHAHVNIFQPLAGEREAIQFL